MNQSTYVPQRQLQTLKEKVHPARVVVLYGPRRTGKTTLLNHFVTGQKSCLMVDGEDLTVREALSCQSIERLKGFVGNHTLLVIDEAQHIPHIGQNLKLIVDQLPQVAIIATGSSSFDLANSLGEPLTGRKRTLRLFPLAQTELSQVETYIETRARLDHRLIYGSYPESVLLQSDRDREEYLVELVQSYLYRDILAIEGIKKSNKMIQLLQMLAYQIGKEVSCNELSKHLGINKLTVERYLDLLEQTFVILRIGGFSRNLRKEITRHSRYYFYDVGIRNALILNFRPLTLRQDVGELWENYLVMERTKQQHYGGPLSHNYFWRTYDQQEIDWIEDRGGELYAYEFQWKDRSEQPGRKRTPPSAWKQAYPHASYQVIDRENYLEFIGVTSSSR